MATEFIAGETPGWQTPATNRWRHAALLALAGALGLEFLAPWLPGKPLVPESMAAWFWYLAAVGAVLGLACRLPLQNTVAVTLQTAFIAWFVALSCRRFLEVASIGVGAVLPGGISSTQLAIWMTLAPCFRDLARAVLTSRRGEPWFGIEVLGVTALLGAATGLALQAASSRPAQPGAPGIWAELQTALLWSSTATLLHVLNTPWVLSKRPSREVASASDLALPALIGAFLVQSLARSGARGMAVGATITLLAVLLLARRGTKTSV